MWLKQGSGLFSSAVPQKICSQHDVKSKQFQFTAALSFELQKATLTFQSADYRLH